MYLPCVVCGATERTKVDLATSLLVCLDADACNARRPAPASTP